MLCSDVCAIVEVLQDPAVSARLSDTKAAAEVKALEDFYTMLQNDPNRAFYGSVKILVLLFASDCLLLHYPWFPAIHTVMQQHHNEK